MRRKGEQASKRRDAWRRSSWTSRAARAAILVAPAGLVAFWGGAYLLQSLDTLLAPGTGIELALATPRGIVRATARSYAIDPAGGVARLEGLRVLAPDGRLLASCARARVEGLDLAGGLRPRIVLLRPRVALARTRRGDLDLAGYLPPSEGPPSDVPYEVEIEDGRLDLRDLAAPSAPLYVLTLPRLHVAGRRGDATATGVAIASQDGVGRVGGLDLSLFRAASGDLRLNARTLGAVDGARLLAALRAGPERLLLAPFGDARTRTLALSGTLSLAASETGRGTRVRFTSNLDARATGLAFRGERLASATFAGRVTERGARGTLTAADGPDRARFVGAARYDDPNRPALAGTLDARLAASARVARYLPAPERAKIAFSGARFRGWIAYGGARTGARASAQGDASLARARYGPLSAIAPSARLAFGGGRLSLRGLKTAATDGRGPSVPLSGAARVDLRARTLLAAVFAPRLSSANLRPYAALPGANLSGGAGALVSGPFSSPTVQARLTAGGSYRVPGGPLLTFAPTVLDASGGLGGGRLGRVALESPYGTLVASGTVDRRRGWDLAFETRGLDLRRFDARARGRADAAGRVRGPLARPHLAARVEGYGIGTPDLTVAAMAADVVADRRRVAVAGLTALRGAGALRGEASLALGSGAIAGTLSAEGLQLSDVAGGSAAGTLDVPRLRIGGTLRNPVARGDLRATGLVAGGVRIPAAEGRVALDRRGLRVAGARATLAGGTVAGAGDYAFAPRSGAFSGRFEGVRAGDLLVRAFPQTAVRGVLAGTYSGRIAGGALARAEAKASADDLTLNRVSLGAGTLSLAYDGARVALDADVGQLARFLAARGVSYDPRTGALAGRVEALGIPIPEIVAAAAPALKDAAPETRARLGGLGGTVALGAELGGTAKAPVIEVSSLGATGLALSGTLYGDLDLAGTYAGGSVVLKKAALRGPNGGLDAAGVVGKNGELDLRLEATDLRSELARPFLPKIADVRAVLRSGTLEIGGTVSAPDARGSLIGYALLPEAARSFEPTPSTLPGASPAPAAPPAPATLPAPAEAGRLNLNLFDVRATPRPEGGTALSVRGLFSAIGFTGDLSADVPLGAPANAPLSGDLNLRPRKLSEVAAYFPGLKINAVAKPGDPDEVGGALRVRGTLEAPTAEGEIVARAGRVSYAGLTTSLVDPRLDLKLAERRLTLDATTASSGGGDVTLALATSIGDLLSGLGGGAKADPDGLRRPLEGTVALNRLRVRQDFPGGAYVDARATTPSPLKLSGTLRAPRLGGSITVGNLDTVLPTIAPGTGVAAGLPIDPVFDLVAAVDGAARVRSTAADIELGGGGTLTGPLSAPKASADFALVRGALRLPGGTVRLDPGGTLALRYDGAAPLGANSAARLDTDLVGRTTITALRNGGPDTERYDVTIGVRGDLLAAAGDPNALVLTARSDPPDLTQERILSLLGRTDIVTGFLDSRDQRALQSQLRSALTGYALPTFFGGFTNALAREFGFDYLSLDYNAYDQASVVFGRSLGSGFSFSGRRQLSEPQPGLPQRYDVRLGFRPRTGGGYARNLSLSVGADELRPYKLSLEYGTRFGRMDSPLRSYSLGVRKGGGK